MFKSCSNKLCEQLNPQPVENFYRRSKSLDGLSPVCKFCKIKYDSSYRKKNIERLRQYEIDRKNIPQRIEQHRKACKKYDSLNRDKIYKRILNRLDSDINFKISRNLRSRLNRSIKNMWKSGSAVRDLGCSIEQLKLYIESKWQDGMNWNNWGKGEGKCQIDHIIPLMKFDLTDRQQFLVASGYTNLQPLWHKDHKVKTLGDLNARS